MTAPESTPDASTEREKAIARYVKKPVAISAIQWDETTKTREALEAIGMRPSRYSGHVERPNECANLSIVTIEGVVHVKRGDWIIKGIKGDFYPCKPDIFAATYDPEAAAIQRGDGLTTEDVKPRDLEQFKIETFRHAGNVIFNQLNEAGFLFGTAQGKEALFTAQRVADLIVHSPHSTALIDSPTPPAAKPNETSGATPRSRLWPQLEELLTSYAQKADAGMDCRAEVLQLAVLAEAQFGLVEKLEAELAAVRKSAGAEGKLHITGREEPDTFDELIADYGFASIERWKRDTERTHSLQKQARENLHTYLNAAKSTPGVETIKALEHIRDAFWSEGESYQERFEYLQDHARETLAKLRAFPDAAQLSDGASGGKEGV